MTTKQTDLERDLAHQEDTLALIKDVLEANKVPDYVAMSAIIQWIFEETLNKSKGDFVNYLVKFDELYNIIGKGSLRFLQQQMKEGKLK